MVNQLKADNPPARRPRDFGIITGVLKTGPLNAITDVPEVLVGHRTLIEGDSIRTGVTAIVPHSENIFRNKLPAAVYVANGFGKLTGVTQMEELGLLETPVILTNTLSVPVAADALIDYTLSFPENRLVRSVNPVVGETNDGWLNDIRGRHITREHVLEAIQAASDGPVAEGVIGERVPVPSVLDSKAELGLHHGGFLTGDLNLQWEYWFRQISEVIFTSQEFPSGKYLRRKTSPKKVWMVLV